MASAVKQIRIDAVRSAVDKMLSSGDANAGGLTHGS